MPPASRPRARGVKTPTGMTTKALIEWLQKRTNEYGDNNDPGEFVPIPIPEITKQLRSAGYSQEQIGEMMGRAQAPPFWKGLLSQLGTATRVLPIAPEIGGAGGEGDEPSGKGDTTEEPGGGKGDERTRGGKDASKDSTAESGATTEAASVGATGGLLGIASVAGLIGSTGDFLKWISWLFNPLNWLRLAEFLTGMVFIFFGLYLQFQRRPLSSTGAGIARVTRELGAATPVGRTVNYSRGRRQGRREGQIEEGRLAGRKMGRSEAASTQARGQKRSASNR